MLDALLRDFRFSIPNGFNFYQAIYLGDAEDAEGVKLVVMKTKVTFRPNIVVSVGKMAGTGGRAVETFVDEQIAILKKAPNYQVLDKKTFEAPRPGVIVRQAMRNADGVGVEQLQLYVALGNEKVLIVTATHLPGKDFKKYEAAFLSMMESLEAADGSRLVEGVAASISS